MRRSRRGNMLVEGIAVIPLLLLLMAGMVQFGKLTFEYYTVKKIVWAAARQLSVQQGVNYCDLANDATATAAINLAVNDPAGTPILAKLTTVDVTPECADSTGALAGCSSCPDTNPQPAYLLVTVPNGYNIDVRIPFLNPVTITFNPSALVPFGGVS